MPKLPKSVVNKILTGIKQYVADAGYTIFEGQLINLRYGRDFELETEDPTVEINGAVSWEEDTVEVWITKDGEVIDQTILSF